MKTSKDIAWNDEAEEFFFLRSGWDVRKAKEILRTKKAREVNEMGIEGVQDLVGEPPAPDGSRKICLMGIRIDWTKALSPEVDMEVPVILVTRKDGSYMPIDGWHRIARAKAEGKTSVWAVLLNKKESKEIEL